MARTESANPERTQEEHDIRVDDDSDDDVRFIMKHKLFQHKRW